MDGLKALMVLGAVVLGSGSASAQVSVETFQNETVLEPGESSDLGELSVDFNESIDEVIERDFSDFPFEVERTNQAFSAQSTEFDAEFNATVPQSYQPENDTREVRYRFSDEAGNISETTFDFTYEVPKQDTINVSTDNISIQRNVGDVGTPFANITVRQEGNVRSSEAGYRFTGNVSELVLNPKSNFTLFRANERRIPFQTDIPLNQEFGNYSGEVEVFSEGDNLTIPVEAEVKDIVAPEISGEVDDIEATRTPVIGFKVTDNIEVRNASVDIDLERNNGTDLNVSDFGLRETKNDQTRYERKFNSTDLLGNYSANVTALDRAGNRRYQNFSFRVTELDSIDVNRTSPRFEAEEVGEPIERQILQVTYPTSVTFNLTEFSEDKLNNTMLVGIRGPNQETAEEFELDEDERETISFSEEGNYTLVLRSSQDEAFRGDINITGIDQHVSTEDVDFSGLFIDPVFPEPVEGVRRGVFEGGIRYESEEATEKQRVIFEGSVSAERCRGFSEFSQCIPGLPLGQLDKDEETIEKLEGERNDWRAIAILSFLSLVVFIGYSKRLRQLKNTVIVSPKVDR